MHNWRRNPSSNWYDVDKNAVLNLPLSCGAIWRHRANPQHRCTTTVHPAYKGSKKDFGKFTFCRTFGAYKLVHSEQFFWTTYTKFDNCCLRYIATMENFLYRCTSTFSALNYCGGIFFKSLSYLYEVVRTNFSADFWIFRNFWRQFRKNCGAIWRHKW